MTPLCDRDPDMPGFRREIMLIKYPHDHNNEKTAPHIIGLQYPLLSKNKYQPPTQNTTTTFACSGERTEGFPWLPLS